MTEAAGYLDAVCWFVWGLVGLAFLVRTELSSPKTDGLGYFMLLILFLRVVIWARA